VVRPLRAAAVGLLALAGVACVDDSIPPRPLVAADAGDPTGTPDGGTGQGAGPVLLAYATPCDGMRLVVSGGEVFWTEEATGMVQSIPTSGGKPTVIASGQVGPTAIAVDGTSIFWVAEGRKVIKKRAIAGGNTSIFVRATTNNTFGLPDENDINALLVSRGTLFFGRFLSVSKIPTDGTVPELIAKSPETDLGRAGAFALDPTHLYQVEISHNAVSREILDGSQNGYLEGDTIMQPFAPDRIAVSRGSLVTDAVAVVDDDVIWANGSDIETSFVGALESRGVMIVTTSVDSNLITGFVVSGGSVFFGESSDDTIEVAPLGRGTVPTVIATNQRGAGQFAADDQNIYWRTSSTPSTTSVSICNIMKLAKP
jgi:hypothetical protein